MNGRTWAVTLLAAALGAAAPAGVCLGQEKPNPEQMKKMYDEAVGQLKAAQERKNQLAAENEKLAQQLEAARKELAAAAARLEEIKQTDADLAERTFFLRAHYAAWQRFVRLSPEVLASWRTFTETNYFDRPLGGNALAAQGWPLIPIAATQPAGTQPAASQPATTQASTTLPATTQSATMPATTQSATQPLSTQPAATQPGTTLPSDAVRPTSAPTTRPA